MEWNSPYLLPLYDALVVPLMILGIGCLIEILTGLIASILRSLLGSKLSYIICNYVTFLGTVHHELSHAFFALVTGAKVTSVELFHVRGSQLGCVTFIPRGNRLTKAIQITFSSVAPVLTGSLSLGLLLYFYRYQCREPWQAVIVLYLFFSILLHMNMSSQDVKNMWKGLPIVIILFYGIFLISGLHLIPWDVII